MKSTAGCFFCAQLPYIRKKLFNGRFRRRAA